MFNVQATTLHLLLVVTVTAASIDFPGGGWRCNDGSRVAYHFRSLPQRENRAINYCLIRNMRLPSIADEHTKCLRNYRHSLFPHLPHQAEMWTARNVSTPFVCSYYPDYDRRLCRWNAKRYSLCKERLGRTVLSTVCNLQPAPENGYVSYPSGISYPSVAQYGCRRNFTLIGRTRISCNRSGLWQYPQPVCAGTQDLAVDELNVSINATIVNCPSGFEFHSRTKAVCRALADEWLHINITVPEGVHVPVPVTVPDDGPTASTGKSDTGTSNVENSCKASPASPTWIKQSGSVVAVCVICILLLVIVILLLSRAQGKLSAAERFTTSMLNRITASRSNEEAVQEVSTAPEQAHAIPGRTSYTQVEIVSNPRGRRTGQIEAGEESATMGASLHTSSSTGENTQQRISYSQVVLKSDRNPTSGAEPSAV
eukprot:scpid30328/ scgid34798/ 